MIKHFADWRCAVDTLHLVPLGGPFADLGVVFVTAGLNMSFYRIRLNGEMYFKVQGVQIFNRGWCQQVAGLLGCVTGKTHLFFVINVSSLPVMAFFQASDWPIWLLGLRLYRCLLVWSCAWHNFNFFFVISCRQILCWKNPVLKVTRVRVDSATPCSVS